MRQPLEEGRVTISRAAGTITFPSQFMLVAAMNPTPDGRMPGESRFSPREIQNYLNRVSGPLLDRIDIHVEVPAAMRSRALSASPERFGRKAFCLAHFGISRKAGQSKRRC